MKNRNLLALAFLCLLNGVACARLDSVPSTVIEDSEIYEHFAVHYQADTNLVNYLAQFRLNNEFGSPIHLISPSAVRLGEQKLQKAGLRTIALSNAGFSPDSFYSGVASLPEPEKRYSFQFTKPSGQQSNVSVEMAKPILVVEPIEHYIYRRSNGPLDLEFEGAPLGNDEKILFTIKSEEDPSMQSSLSDEDRSMVSWEIKSGFKAKLPKKAMENFRLGMAYATVERIKVKTMTPAETSGRKLVSSFRSKRTYFVIAE